MTDCRFSRLLAKLEIPLLLAVPAVMATALLAGVEQAALAMLVVVALVLALFFAGYEASRPGLRQIMPTLVLAALARIFVIPRFKYKPGKLQLLLEELVTFFQNLAQTNSPHRNGFLGAYLFGAGVYVLFGTLFELFGLQAVTTAGGSISLPAPLSDINAAISVGCMSYLVILGGGIAANKLKDFSLHISMSFRLFGALLSGLLVTELVYYSLSLSFVLPVFVGVMFTLLHALIQTYVLTTLVSIFYGEVTEPHNKKVKQAA